MQIVGQRCSGSGWSPIQYPKRCKVFIDFNQDGVFNPNTENVYKNRNRLAPTYNVFNVMIPATALTGTTHEGSLPRLGTVLLYLVSNHASRDV